MKKLAILLSILLTVALMVNAQNHHSILSPADQRFETGFSQLKGFQSGWTGFEFINKSIITRPGSLSWKLDTIICYNDLDVVIERITQTFDNKGNVLTQLIEKKQRESQSLMTPPRISSWNRSKNGAVVFGRIILNAPIPTI